MGSRLLGGHWEAMRKLAAVDPAACTGGRCEASSRMGAYCCGGGGGVVRSVRARVQEWAVVAAAAGCHTHAANTTRMV
jgi:hypothetical protein